MAGNGKVTGKNMNDSQRILTTNKDVASVLGRSPRFVQDMKRGGFRMPATANECKQFLRRHPRPTQFRRAGCR